MVFVLSSLLKTVVTSANFNSSGNLLIVRYSFIIWCSVWLQTSKQSCKCLTGIFLEVVAFFVSRLFTSFLSSRLIKKVQPGFFTADICLLSASHRSRLRFLQFQSLSPDYKTSPMEPERVFLLYRGEDLKLAKSIYIKC